MRTFLLIVGIILIAAAVLSLLFAALNMFGYRHTLDGSAELYAKMRTRARVFLIVGLVTAALGAACIIIRTRI